MNEEVIQAGAELDKARNAFYNKPTRGNFARVQAAEDHLSRMADSHDPDGDPDQEWFWDSPSLSLLILDMVQSSIKGITSSIKAIPARVFLLRTRWQAGLNN